MEKKSKKELDYKDLEAVSGGVGPSLRGPSGLKPPSSIIPSGNIHIDDLTSNSYKCNNCHHEFISYETPSQCPECQSSDISKI